MSSAPSRSRPSAKSYPACSSLRRTISAGLSVCAKIRSDKADQRETDNIIPGYTPLPRSFKYNRCVSRSDSTSSLLFSTGVKLATVTDNPIEATWYVLLARYIRTLKVLLLMLCFVVLGGGLGRELV